MNKVKKGLDPQEQPKAINLTEAEKSRIEAFAARRKNTPSPSRWKNVEKADAEKPVIENDLTKGAEYFAAALSAATGTVHFTLASHLVDRAANATYQSFDDPARHFNMVTAAMTGLAPQDELEGLLVTQMVTAHSMAMECARRANLKEQTFEGRRLNLAFADRFMRTFALQVEALTRYRKGGQQKVVVEHVHVNKGGQAIVGTVNHGTEPYPRRGEAQESEGTTSCIKAIEEQQKGAPLSAARSKEVWCEEQADEKTLSSTGNVERKMSAPRR